MLLLWLLLFWTVATCSFCTTVTNESGLSVSTIEHLMGALYGIGIDNAIIEINSQEVPILDGSAKLFIKSFLKAGLKFSDQPIKIIKINKYINFQEGEKKISIFYPKMYPFL